MKNQKSKKRLAQLELGRKFNFKAGLFSSTFRFEHSLRYAYTHIYEKNMAKWGIPEKSIKNVAQGCLNQVRRTLRSKVMANNFFCKKNALYFTL